MQILPRQVSFYSWSKGKSHRVFNNQPGQNATVSWEASIVAFKRISHPPATAMTMAELLGFDMSLPWKLSTSVAAVLLVSWAYRFCCSRAAREIQRDKWKPKLQDNAKPSKISKTWRRRRRQATRAFAKTGWPAIRRKQQQIFFLHRAKNETLTLSCCDVNATLENETLFHQEFTKDTNTNV